MTDETVGDRWSDERVREKAETWESLWVGQANMPAADYIEAAMLEVRDALRATIAKLEAQLKQANDDYKDELLEHDPLKYDAIYGEDDDERT